MTKKEKAAVSAAARELEKIGFKRTDSDGDDLFGMKLSKGLRFGNLFVWVYEGGFLCRFSDPVYGLKITSLLEIKSAKSNQFSGKWNFHFQMTSRESLKETLVIINHVLAIDQDELGNR